MVYDDIDGLEEMLLDLSNVSLFSHFDKISWLWGKTSFSPFIFRVGLNIIDISLQVGNNENNTNSVEASETMSTNSASSPIPYSFNHSSSIDLMNENDTKRRHRSSTDDNKMVRTFNSIRGACVVTSKVG